MTARHGEVVEDRADLGLDEGGGQVVHLATTVTVLWAVTAVTTVVPNTPRAPMVLMSAWMPGPRPRVGAGDGHGHRRDRPRRLTTRPCPSDRLEARAWNRRVIRPARRADRPEVTASRMASAISRRVAGPGHRRGHQHGVAPELHGQTGVRGRADAGVEDHRDPGLLDDEGDVVGIADAEAAADGGPEGHHRGTADLLEAPGGDRVVVAVGEDHEPVVDQRLGRRHQLDGVGQQGAVVPDDLELHPVGLEGLPGQLGGEHGIGGGEAPGGVGQDVDAQLLQQVDQ